MDSARISMNDLARACADSADAGEWEEFVRRTVPLVSLVVARVARVWVNGSPPVPLEDIVQEVYLKLCEQRRRILREFEPRGEDSFLGLLRIVATSVANDYFRRIRSAKRGGKTANISLTFELIPAAGGGIAGLHRSVLQAQIDRRLREAPETISERDRTLFWLYYLHGFTAEEIASVPAIGLSGKGVESALRRVAHWLRAQIGNAPAQEKSGTNSPQPAGPGEGKLPEYPVVIGRKS
jgi:RNA polymerase sigma-70 factor, ECF subfamily